MSNELVETYWGYCNKPRCIMAEKIYRLGKVGFRISDEVLFDLVEEKMESMPFDDAILEAFHLLEYARSSKTYIQLGPIMERLYGEYRSAMEKAYEKFREQRKKDEEEKEAKERRLKTKIIIFVSFVACSIMEYMHYVGIF